jgi:hypothetical protein
MKTSVYYFDSHRILSKAQINSNAILKTDRFSNDIREAICQCLCEIIDFRNVLCLGVDEVSLVFGSILPF